MTNLPIVLQEGGSNPPQLPESLLAGYNAIAEQMVAGFQGAFNRIKVGKMDFSLVEGGVARRVANGEVVGVCLGMSGVDYCSWYEKTYEPGQEPEMPDLVWNWPDHNQFPEALPAQWRQKRNRQNQDRWDFRIARRSVWALLHPDPQTGQFFLGVESPYIFDVTSASLYGKSDTVMGWYKWAGLIQLCNRFSQPPNFFCSPAMFLTRIRIDPTSTVSGVVYFEPMLTPEKSLTYLDSNTFAQVVEVMQSQTIRDMLQVREILEWPKNSTPTAQTSGQASAPVTEQSVSNPSTTFAPTSQPVQHQPAPTQVTPPMQAATSVAEPTTDPETQSRLAAAQAILNQEAPASSASEAPQAEPDASASQTPGASSNVNGITADAIRAFSDAL